MVSGGTHHREYPISFSLVGTLVLVTGAGRGNGRAISMGMAAAGAQVVLGDLEGSSVDAVARDIHEQGGNARAYTLDITDAACCAALADRVAREVGDVSCLVNNAGVLLHGRFGDAQAPDKWRQTLEVNVVGTLNMTYAFLGALRKTRGNVINLGSIASFVSSSASSAYAASKGAIAQITRSLAAELAPDGIRVNAIAPGTIDTAMTSQLKTDAERLHAFQLHTPMRRIGRPSELAGPAIFLASPAASYVTGVVLPVDGGYLVA